MKKTGGLIEIDGTTFAQTYKRLDQSSRAVVADARAIAYWCNKGSGGRFTPLMANYLKVFIQSCIDGEHPDVTASFNNLTTKHTNMKKFHGHSPHFWNRTGTLKSAFRVTTSRVGDYSMGTVTLDPQVTSPRGNSGPGISVDKLAKYLEFGTSRMQARPLISYALRKFTSVHAPRMLGAIRESLSQWILDNHNPRAPLASREAVGADFDDNPDRAKQTKDAFTKGEVTVGAIHLGDNKDNADILKIMKAAGTSQKIIDRVIAGMKSKN